MTVFHELRSMVDAMRQRQIAITLVLEQLANNQDIRSQTRDLVAEPHMFDGEVPDWLSRLMLEAGLSEEEVAHAGAWPDVQKEVARLELLRAYDANQPVHFAWDVHRGTRQFTKINERDNGETEIAFSDPRQSLAVDDNGGVVIQG